MNQSDVLNADCNAALLDAGALHGLLDKQGQEWASLLAQRCPHLISPVPVFISPNQLRAMYQVVSSVESLVNLQGWLPSANQSRCKGVLYGFDFHLNAEGVHLIEINTNAGGAFINELLIASQLDHHLPGRSVSIEHLESALVAMFANEWKLERGSAPLKAMALIDSEPEGQYLYPEFLLAKRMLERAGLVVEIVDPSSLEDREDGLYAGHHKIDMIYNRLTDFLLQAYPWLIRSNQEEKVVLTPGPVHFERYASKGNLVRMSSEQNLRSLGLDQPDLEVLLAHVPKSILVSEEDSARLWSERKDWFFKPIAGFGSKGAYRGEGITKRVFSEIIKGGYIAQRMAPPGERSVCLPGGAPVLMKFDVRCYVYDGHILMAAARLYHGQTTNFRTPGGGFALVRVVE